MFGIGIVYRIHRAGNHGFCCRNRLVLNLLQEIVVFASRRVGVHLWRGSLFLGLLRQGLPPFLSFGPNPLVGLSIEDQLLIQDRLLNRLIILPHNGFLRLSKQNLLNHAHPLIVLHLVGRLHIAHIANGRTIQPLLFREQLAVIRIVKNPLLQRLGLWHQRFRVHANVHHAVQRFGGQCHRKVGAVSPHNRHLAWHLVAKAHPPDSLLCPFGHGIGHCTHKWGKHALQLLTDGKNRTPGLIAGKLPTRLVVVARLIFDNLDFVAKGFLDVTSHRKALHGHQ